MTARGAWSAPERLEARELLSFAAPVGYNVGSQADGFIPNASPATVATADFNGDGRLDLAVVHISDNSVSTLLNNGDGTFQPAVRKPVGEVIQGNVRVGDFNGDGRSDLFLPGGSNQAVVLLGNGDGTFQSRIDSSSFSVAGTYPRGWAVGDFDGDGKLDVAATLPSVSTDSGGYTVLLGNGDGTFRPGLVGPMVLHYARWVTAGDFDGDGRLDLAVADGQGQGTQTGTAELTILLGHGDGTFGLGGRYASPQTGTEDEVVNPEDVFAADLNRDGKLDAIVSDYSHNINVFLGNGDGTFQPARGVETGEYPRAVDVADVDGDGRADLVVTNVGINVGGAQFAAEGAVPGSVAVLPGNGDGTFQGPVQYQPFAYPGWTAVGDFDGDGSPDLAVSRVLDGHSVSVMLNRPSSNNLPPTVAAGPGATPGPVVGTTTALDVLGADDGGEAILTYTWTTIGSVPAPVTFSANGTNTARDVTATFSKAGTYQLAVTITDAGGLSVVGIVMVTVNPTLASIAVSPSVASVAPGVTQPFAAVALDQFGTALATQPAFTWAVSGGGTISTAGLFTAGSALGGPFAVTATAGGIGGTAGVTVANTGTLTAYSLAGDGRVANLNSAGTGAAFWDAVHDAAVGLNVDDTTANRTNWAGVLQASSVVVLRGYLAFDTSALPAGAVITGATLGVFVTGKTDDVNDGNDFVSVVRGFQASPNGLAGGDFSKAGDAIDHPTEGSNRLDISSITTGAYAQWALNASGLSWIAPGGITTLAVREGHDILDVWPGFTGSQTDSIGASMSEQPGTSQDPYLRITYTIPAANQPPTIATPAAASPNPVSGTTAELSVLGSDDGGEPGLTYTWTTTGTPPAPVTFGANGTNAAKITTATFHEPGVYTLQVTVADPDGLEATSTVTVTVNPAGSMTTVTSSLPSSTYGRSLTFTATVAPSGAGGPTPTGTVQFQVDGTNLGGAVVLVDGKATSPTIASLGAGIHIVTARYSGSPESAPSSGDRPQPVAKAHLTVAAASRSKVYGGPVPGLSFSITGFVNGDTARVVTGRPALSTKAARSSPAGAYPIVVGRGTLNAANYDFPRFVNGTLTVTRAHLTVTAKHLTRSQGQPNPPLTYVITGFVNGDTARVVTGRPALSTKAARSSPAGAYPIVVGRGTLNAANYDFPRFVNGILTVIKKAPSKARAATRARLLG